ncbi:MAG: hypothetical protein JWP80_3445 [Pseudomonas sp.]|nr:hypothetical protein [Pseudomonas sp.]
MKEKDHWIDYAKAIGIILVVYGHAARGIHGAGLPIDESFFRIVDSIIYSFHMPLFFFLSGLLFYDSLIKRGTGGFIVNKIDTIVYPFILWSLLQGSVEVALTHYTTHGLSFSEVLSFFWSPRAQFWFLHTLFCIFVLCALIYSLMSKAYSFVLFIALALLFVMSNTLQMGLLMDYIAGNAVFFVLGIEFEGMRDFFKRRYRALALIFGAVFLAAQTIFHFVLKQTYDVGGVGVLLLAVVSILFIVALSMWLSTLRSRWMLFIGTSSMAIYLMHILAGSGVRILLINVAGIRTASTHLIVGTVLGVTAPLLALILIERYKLNFLFAPPRPLSATGMVERLNRRASPLEP